MARGSMYSRSPDLAINALRLAAADHRRDGQIELAERAERQSNVLTFVKNRDHDRGAV